MPRKKIKDLSEKKKAEIKENWNSYKPKNQAEKTYLGRVKGGKARAKHALKDDHGKYITRELREEIIGTLAAQKQVSSYQEGRNLLKTTEEILKEAKITPRELKEHYENNKQEFLLMVQTGSKKGKSMDSNKLEEWIEDYTGHLYVKTDADPARKISKDEAIYLLQEFNQLLKASINAVDFSIIPQIKFDGTAILHIPDPEKLTSLVLSNLGVEDIKEAMREDPEGWYETINDSLGEWMNDSDEFQDFGEYIAVYTSPSKK